MAAGHACVRRVTLPGRTGSGDRGVPRPDVPTVATHGVRLGLGGSLGRWVLVGHYWRRRARSRHGHVLGVWCGGGSGLVLGDWGAARGELQVTVTLGF